MIEWFARNPVAANILMFAIVVAGLITATTSVPVETFPSFVRDQVIISTQFRGGTPKTVEDAITLRIEEAIADVEGVDELVSRSTEGSSSVTVEVADGYDLREVLDDVKVRVDAINTLPADAEKPTISITIRNPVVIYAALSGDVDNKTLRETADRFREQLLTSDTISNVEIQGIADYEINIEVSPQALDSYNLTLSDIGQAIRNGAADVSAGNVQTRDGDILVRSDGQAYTAAEFAVIPIIPNTTGSPITLGQIANIKDGFEESDLKTTFNGKPAVMVEVRRVGQQSAIDVAETTRQHIDEFRSTLPTGMEIGYWDDDSEYLISRLSAVVNSAIYGGLLVIVLLSLFLRPQVGLWVFLGIPVSFMGAFIAMPHFGATFNVVSLFAFILVLGIVVDDAIVTGESIYRKIREGMDPLQASIVGTKEIAVPVTFGILTTAVAFMPMIFLGEGWLAFIGAQLPVIVVPVLLMSLVESKFVLPSHLSHVKPREVTAESSLLARTQQKISRGLEHFVDTRYKPFLQMCLRNQGITVTLLFSISAIIGTWVMLGYVKYSHRPDIEASTVTISLTMPESTGFAVTDGHIQRITSAFAELQEKYSDPETGESVILNVLATSGSTGGSIAPNVGRIRAELQIEERRVMDVSARQIAREVREIIGDIPGAQQLGVSAVRGRDSAPINIELSGADRDVMGEVILLLRQKMLEYPPLYDIQDNYRGGKEEFQIELTPRAYALGFQLNEVATQVRHALFGFQAQRIQRGRDELRVMVRFPKEYRSSLADLNQLPIRVPGTDKEVLLSEIAKVEPKESPSSLYRYDRRSTLNVTADVDSENANVPLILSELNSYLREVQESYPDISYRFDGDAEEAAETNRNLLIGLLVVLATIYVLLAIPLRSYGQPLIVMSIIPFSLVGALLGHLITGQSLSGMSLFGALALVGVVVNDSLVLVDYINQQRQRGMEVLEAVTKAATVRFRPVLLTSLTTFAGVTPLLLDGSQQARWLKPTATSLGFGIVFATLITLVIVPVNYVLARKFKYFCINLWQRWLAYWNKEDTASHQPLNEGR